MNNTQIELRLPAGIVWKPRVMSLPPDLSFEQKMEVGRYLFQMDECVEFWRTDWYRAMRRDHGEERLVEAVKQLDLEFKELRGVKALNALEVREAGLTKEHHFVLAKMCGPAVTRAEGQSAEAYAAAKVADTERVQKMWAELAVKEGLTPTELQVSIRKGTVTHAEHAGPGGAVGGGGGATRGMASFEGLRVQWEILYRQIAPVLPEWTQAEALSALGNLEGMLRFAEELRRRFAPEGGSKKEELRSAGGVA